MTIVYMRHCRANDLCARGCRAWFKQHGLNWSDFLENGISAEALRATKSSLCEQAITSAEREKANG